MAFRKTSLFVVGASPRVVGPARDEADAAGSGTPRSRLCRSASVTPSRGKRAALRGWGFYFRALGAGLAALVLVGCSSTARRVPVPYAIELSADPKVNPDVHGRPSPIQITVYELSSSSAFESRDFFSLQADPQAALGKELLNTDQAILRPGETKTLQYTGSADARMVGIVAAYRDLEKSHWRLVVPLPEAQNTNIYKIWQFSPNEETIKVSVKDNELAVTDRERSWWPF